MSEQRAAELLRQMLSAIAYCHERGIVHRDVRPGNFLFSSTEIDSDIKLVHFIFSHRLDSTNKLDNKIDLEQKIVMY